MPSGALLGFTGKASGGDAPLANCGADIHDDGDGDGDGGGVGGPRTSDAQGVGPWQM